MKAIIATFFLIVLLSFPLSSFGEIQTIIHTVKQPFGGNQSPDDALVAGTAKAKREALEMAGVYVEALTVVKDAKIEKDEILALTAGVLQAEVVSQKNYVTGNAFGIEIIVKVKVDTTILEEWVKKMLQDKTYIDQLKKDQEREKELLTRVAGLEKENEELSQKGQRSEKLKEQFQEVSQDLTAVNWVYQAFALWSHKSNEYTNPLKAIEYLNHAIRLKPDYAEAYSNRGWAYANLGQYDRAVEDYNKAIQLKPDLAEAYSNRGLAYSKLGQNDRAIEDYNKAIQLKPDLAEAYSNRGLAYSKLGQNDRAIEDYNKAIRLKPDLAEASSTRGLAYRRGGHNDRAIEEYNNASHL
ncbi:MAG: tetratricopeptide repeat protein [Syntrophales bacterium]